MSWSFPARRQIIWLVPKLWYLSDVSTSKEQDHLIEDDILIQPRTFSPYACAIQPHWAFWDFWILKSQIQRLLIWVLEFLKPADVSINSVWEWGSLEVCDQYAHQRLCYRNSSYRSTWTGSQWWRRSEMVSTCFHLFWRICQNDHSWIIFRNDHRRRKNTVSKMSKSGAQCLWWGVVKFSRHRRAEAIFSRLFFIFYIFLILNFFLALPGGTPIVSPTHTSSQMPGRIWWRQRCATFLSHCSYYAAAIHYS